MWCFVNCLIFLGKVKIFDDSFVLDLVKSIVNEKKLLNI